MTKLMEKAILRARELPEDRQDALAELILDFAEEPREWLLTDEQAADVERSRQQVREGKLATPEEMADVWRSFRR